MCFNVKKKVAYSCKPKGSFSRKFSLAYPLNNENQHLRMWCVKTDIMLCKEVLTYVADIDPDEKPQFFFLLVNSSRQLRK